MDGDQIDAMCPACGQRGLRGFHRQDGVPVNSCLLLDTEAEAAGFPTGSIHLGFCPACGFIANVEFDEALAEYSQRYEETQGFSPRFQRFARELAAGWIERYDLAGKTVLEIGCGKGEFLAGMAELGIGHGIGIDPGVKPERIDTTAADRLTWLPRRFTAADADLVGDAVVCRHTLEHLAPVREFIRGLRTAIGERSTVVLFELPDTQRVLDEAAFWDVYYEHCSYFTAGSLARLFERCGFDVLDLRKEYDEQYLIIEARPVPGTASSRPWPADDMDRISAGVDHFAAAYGDMVGEWQGRLEAVAAAGRSAVIWGASSKGVAFLTAAGDHVAAAVDINPHKHGTFIAGTGHPIVAPAELTKLRPALVVAMNPIYLDEIRADLVELGVDAELVGA